MTYWTIKSLEKEGPEVDPARLELRVYEKPKREKIMMRMRVKRYREKLKALAQKCNVTLQNRRTET